MKHRVDDPSLISSNDEFSTLPRVLPRLNAGEGGLVFFFFFWLYTWVHIIHWYTDLYAQIGTQVS